MKKLILTVALITTSVFSFAQSTTYWQQNADYKMEVEMDVKSFKYKGSQQVIYTNNSSDTLYKVYFHLYNNAFQPGSEMDVRLSTISDPDKRMVKSFKKPDNTETKESKIATLKPNEIGFLKINNFKQDGQATTTKTTGTIFEVTLAKAILPNQKSTFDFQFDGQVPLQIRRSGRNSEEGVALSMSQWYPKMAEYDFEGWHLDPYIGREFHGVWGNFDVKITIDKNYMIGGTGYLQNANQIGHGYQDQGVIVNHPKKTKTLTWHFLAPNVHDFTWAADNNYLHDKLVLENGKTLHFIYKNDPDILKNWKELQPKTKDLMNYFENAIGPYPYNQYSVIQGGDGGMEYAMSTLITGKRSLPSLVGVTAHELAHSWFQFVLAFNESKYYWMDEGFTSFMSDLAVNAISGKEEEPIQNAYKGYYYLVETGKQVPLTTHADRYEFNQVYGISAYNKGSVFLSQLGYVIGYDKLIETLRRFYKEFKFKHPTPTDFIRVAEKVSNIHLGWYLTDFAQTTNTIDYGIKSVEESDKKTKITLERIGLMPMPLDIYVEYQDGTAETFYIPIRLMYGSKNNPYEQLKRTELSDWAWSFPKYEFEIPKAKKDIKIIAIDPENMMADIQKENNIFEQK